MPVSEAQKSRLAKAVSKLKKRPKRPLTHSMTHNPRLEQAASISETVSQDPAAEKQSAGSRYRVFCGECARIGGVQGSAAMVCMPVCVAAM